MRVPADLQVIVGATHVSRSLRTASLTVARRLAKTIAYDLERRFEAAREAHQWPMTGGTVTEFANEVRANSAPLVRDITFRKVTELYLTDPTISRSLKSQIVYRATLATIGAILGPELPVRFLTRDACRDVLSTLQRLPPNARKRWPNMSPVDVAEEAHRQGIPPMSSANCNEYMNKLSSLLNWAVREEMLHRNPARGLRIADGILAREKRNPLSIEQLQTIFDAPIYRGCKDDENGYSLVGPNRPRRARFWIPLVALWSGLRQGEICQMLTHDVREVEGVCCFLVSAEGEGKRLKTAASERLVPLHPELQKIGFTRYVSARRVAGDMRLFPDLSEDSLGLYSGKFSKWFSRFLVSCGAAGDRSCFHGFRHSFRDALREAKIDRDVALTLGGWTTTSANGAGAVADAYGRGYRPRLLNEALSQISYPGLDLSHLYPDDAG